MRRQIRRDGREVLYMREKEAEEEEPQGDNGRREAGKGATSTRLVWEKAFATLCSLFTLDTP